MDERAAFQAAVDQFSDWRWRLSNLYWITNEKGERVRFEMNWAQESLFEGMHYLNVILKARQLGFTTFIQIFLLDACLFNRDIRAGTIAHTLDDAKVIFRDKVKFPYDNLPEGLKAAVPVRADTALELLLANNSSIRVGTSLRGGTLQYLHISEYGKICAKFPEKAREVRTGALNTVQAGQLVFIESTAEGQEGHFYDLCQDAQEAERRGKALSAMDFKFHFFPWWKAPKYALDPEGVEIPAGLATYFDELAAKHGIRLSAEQKAWYAGKHKTQGSDMKREFPSTPDEAFEAAIEGAYYGDLMAQADSDKRITRVPHDPNLPVHTAWDLGLDDCTAIWFAQRVGAEWRLIDYLEASGYALPWYVKELDKKPYRYGECILPHDGGTRELITKTSRRETLESLGVRRIKVNPRRPKEDSINGVRQILPKCVFDAEKCAAGLKALRAYRREWDEHRGTWKDEPKHDWASHPADAFAELAAGNPQNGSPSGQAKINYPNLGLV